jgi:hypothetical protein
MAQIATSEPDRVLRRPLSHTTASVAKRPPQVTQSTVSLRTNSSRAGADPAHARLRRAKQACACPQLRRSEIVHRESERRHSADRCSAGNAVESRRKVHVSVCASMPRRAQLADRGRMNPTSALASATPRSS